jgi:hypothetical protein
LVFLAFGLGACGGSSDAESNSVGSYNGVKLDNIEGITGVHAQQTESEPWFWWPTTTLQTIK